MEKAHRSILRQKRAEIVQDLEVKYILDSLIEKDVINNEEQQRILAHPTTQDQARQLLDILPKKGPRTFDAFLESLEPDFPHIKEELVNNIRNTGSDSASITDSYKDILMRGGVPTHPNSVERNLMRNITGALQEVRKGKYVVLHGMPGSGKSVIAAECLWRNADLVNNYFQDGVFWVKVGDVQPDQLLSRFRALCTKLDYQPLPNDIDEGQEILRKLLSDDKYENCLLVLDDVWKPEVIRAFQLPVKIMLTTQDSSIMDVINKDCYNLVDCQEGFSEKESLGFFSSTLKIGEKELPDEAAEIHDAAKGNPMIISLIASLINQTKAQKSLERWRYYLSSLKNRRYNRITRQTSYDHAGILDAVKMSIDALDPDLREKYEQLVVFLDDDMIPTAALQKLWDLDQYEVEDIMIKLVKKSLAFSEWDSIQESTLYSFHDLHLEILRSQYETPSGKQKLKEMHANFVNKYLQTVDYIRFEALENDNYILTHLAYHLSKAGMNDYFPRIFLNLLYIEKVIKEFGTAGILHDYKRYRSLIEVNRAEEFGDTEEFCRTSGVVMCANKDVDIIQLGLGEPEYSKVFEKAKMLADSEENAYYLEWSNREGVNSRTIATVMHRDKEAHDISFLPDRRIATVTGDGVIKIWDWVHGEVVQRLRGHEGSVNCISYEPSEGLTLCSGGRDGTVKLWKLAPIPEPDHHAEHDKQNFHGRRGSVMKKSPKTSQPETWNQLNIFHKDDSVKTIKVTASTDKDLNEITAINWRPNSMDISVATRSGTVLVYGENYKERFRITRHNDVVNAIAFNHTGELLAVCGDDTTVTVWNASTGNFLADIRYHDIRVIGLAWLGHLDKLASISQDDLVVWENPGTGAKVNPLTRNRGASWHCVAANDKIIAAGTITEKLVVLWCVETRQVVAALTGQTSHLVNLSFIQTEEEDEHEEEGDYDKVILAGLSEQMLIVWAVDNVESDAIDPELLPLGPKHHTRWLKPGAFINNYNMAASNITNKKLAVLRQESSGGNVLSEDAITAAPDDRNRITILKNGRRIFASEPELDEITALRLSKDCDYVVYGTSVGFVKKFKFDKRHPSVQTLKEKHSSPIITIKVTSSGIVVSGGNDHKVKIYHPDGRIFTCEGHQSCVRDVELICGETQVLSCDREGILRIWDIETGLELEKFSEGFTSFSSCLDVWEGEQESLAAVGGVTGGVSIINLQTGKCLIKIAEQGPEIRRARFGPAGNILATGHDTGETQVWDIKTGRSLLTSPLKLHNSWVKDLAISKDGKKMLTVGDRLIWWSLEYLAKPQPLSAGPKRKLSLPMPSRSRRSSESRSNASSIHEDSLDGAHLANLSNLNRLSLSGSNSHIKESGSHGSSPMSPPSVAKSPQILATSPPAIKSPLLPPMSPLLSSQLRRHKIPYSAGSAQKRPNSLNLENVRSPNSPAANRKDKKTGKGSQKELLQTFDMKGSSADRVFINQDFTQFVTIDDAGILYILNEYRPDTEITKFFPNNLS